MKKIYSLAATAVLLLASTNANAQWTDTETGVTYTVVAGTKFGQSEGAEEACDGKAGTKLGTTDCPNYIIIEASEPVSCVGYAITTGSDNASWTGRNPQSWYVDGCNELDSDDPNSSEWDPIDEVLEDEVLQDLNSTEYSFTCETSAKYKYFRFEVIKVEGGGFCQYSEFHIKGLVDHHWDDGTVYPPTCVDYGYTVYTCKDGDGATRTETNYDAPPTGIHNYVDGKCTVCGHYEGTLKALPVTEGWNADVVVEALPVADHLTLGFDNAETGFATEDVVEIGGLPANGQITTTTEYTYTMDYTTVSSLRMGDQNTYELTVDPVSARALFFLGTSAGGASDTNVTVNYSDGTTQTGTISWVDWFGDADTNVVITGLNRFYNSNEDGRAGFRVSETIVETDPAKTVESITFQQTTSKTPVIMAIGYLEGSSTGISEVNANANTVKTYNLQGMEVKANKAGLYIQNGKKVIVK